MYYRILDAADYGVPQHRERLFIVGLKEGEYLFPYPTHGPDSLDRQPYCSAAQDWTNARTIIRVQRQRKLRDTIERETCY
ncbi:MAG: hypothetical protein HC847_13965 [Hydrococcus sp. RU_2_2]|nr:hypothetical protein [Hydrococcus sp. RU_2_2]NJP18518.1 hypothetical protein [Hydrococcus sp. CRU_1_1]NJQ98614.1 hypothetical protein [Hydrococcus sp. CSU_1_8]